MKIERDHAEILGGVMGGMTSGAPLAFRIANLNHDRWQGKAIEPFTMPRPGHADLTGTLKYDYNDLRPSLERASARETAARVAVGAVCKHFLSQFGVRVLGYVISLGDIDADLEGISLVERGERAEASDVRCPDPLAAARMQKRIRQIIDEKDTLGGVIEMAALGLPPGLGSHVHWDRKLEARLGAAVLSIQAIKGVEIGTAFENTRQPGTQVHDAIRLSGDQNQENSGSSRSDQDNETSESQPRASKLLYRPTNRAGGLEGGITNGQPLLVRAAMKPIATTLTPQSTVDLVTGLEVPTQYERSDFCPVPRAVPIVEAMVAFVLADALIEKLGGDSMAEMSSRFKDLPAPRLEDFHLDNTPQTFWP
jgi:chorismate synthase